MTEQLFEKACLAYLARPSNNDDPTFSQELNSLAADLPSKTGLKQLRRMEQGLLTRSSHPSLRQQTRFWYLAGLTYTYLQQRGNAFEAFEMSAQSLARDMAVHPIVIVQIHRILAPLAWQNQLLFEAFTSYQLVCDNLRRLRDLNDRTLSRAEWDAALAEAEAAQQSVRQILEQAGTFSR